MRQAGTAAGIWRKLRRGAGLVGCLLAASCAGSGGLDFGGQQPAGPVQTFETVGSGSVKVALLLPMSAGGGAGKTAKALKEAAEMALFEFNNPDIVLVPKDTGGTAAGATAAAQAAIAEGAELIVGPLFAQSVAAVGPVARNANVPVIAFSTDSNVAGRGVYLLSFLPNDDIAQIVDFAVSKRLASFGALLPETAYGTIAEGALRQKAGEKRAQVVMVEKYAGEGQGTAEAAQRISAIAKGANPKVSAIVMPDGPGPVRALLPALVQNGTDLKRVKLLGSGQWDDPALLREPALAGAWYAAPDPSGWRDFSSRYQAIYGVQPPRIATIAYDAVSLAAALARQPKGERYTSELLTNSGGFAGVDGIFRFNASGLNQRGLAILEIQPGGGTRVIRAAPTSFAGANF
ncbi:MAG: penicillin-binding protein activator [Rhodobiaceae bacterium]|nr:penicillin-binding protein activator [Rhodobiaceae bacterium]